MKKNHLFSALKIIELRGQILNFNIQNFSTINFDQAAKIRSFDLELSMLLKGITKYDFISKKILAPVKDRFDPNDYSQYQHSMTNNEDSAIDEYSKFATWEFKI